MTPTEEPHLPAMVQLEERRQAGRKRVSSTVAELRIREGGWPKRAARGSVTIEDLSETGARLIGPAHDALSVGSTIEIKLADTVGHVVVRRIGPDPLDAENRIYGVEIAADQEGLRQAIRARLDEEATPMEWIWTHTDEVDRLLQG